MEQTRGSGEAGFTLVEIVVVVAIVVTTVLAGVAISLGSRSFAVATAASEFDHLLDSARTVARETRGATLVFAPDVFGDGTEVRVLAPGPNGDLSPTKLPPFHTRAAIEESESLGKAPFAFVLHATGALGGRPGYRSGNPNTIPEVGCPARGSFHFLIHAAGATAERTLPCRITLAATGPLMLATLPPASVAPLPTPCSSDSCGPSTLPTPPSSNPTCPANFAVTLSGCTPTSTVTTRSDPRYHVMAVLASPVMMVDGVDSITATAVLSNPADVPLGTVSSIPVSVTISSGPCAVSPSGPNPSGTVFMISASSSGTCLLSAQADTSTVLGASADTATATISVIASNSTSPPRPCDLFTDGKCYKRIVNRTSATFWKYVVPDTACGDVDGTSTCWYINAIQQIFLASGYGVQPVTPAYDSDHELLFKINAVGGIILQCQPFAAFAQLPAPNQINWGGTGVGAPVDPPDGFGDPSTFFTRNHIILQPQPNGFFTVQQPSNDVTTAEQLYDAVAKRVIGMPTTFTYSSKDATPSMYIQWHPEFPGCESLYEGSPGEGQYGNLGVALFFEIFQAVP